MSLTLWCVSGRVCVGVKNWLVCHECDWAWLSHVVTGARQFDTSASPERRAHRPAAKLLRTTDSDGNGDHRKPVNFGVTAEWVNAFCFRCVCLRTFTHNASERHVRHHPFSSPLCSPTTSICSLRPYFPAKSKFCLHLNCRKTIFSVQSYHQQEVGCASPLCLRCRRVRAGKYVSISAAGRRFQQRKLWIRMLYCQNQNYMAIFSICGGETFLPRVRNWSYSNISTRHSLLIIPTNYQIRYSSSHVQSFSPGFSTLRIWKKVSR